MDTKAYEDAKAKFLKAFANLPPPERELIIAIVEGQTYSWLVSNEEIENNTELGKKILMKIKAMGII